MSLFQVPLKDSSIDIAVFCLSLMGTNLSSYLLEANRVLKHKWVPALISLKQGLTNLKFHQLAQWVYTFRSSFIYPIISGQAKAKGIYAFQIDICPGYPGNGFVRPCRCGLSLRSFSFPPVFFLCVCVCVCVCVWRGMVWRGGGDEFVLFYEKASNCHSWLV